ncbi:hypothetical protein M422DRAFT_161626 [Sphaerobolus stellatus SS14]|nr:hypothetical protein M422DRAFT_161626 [Sphaerobolus stellatus SS14]
MATDIDNLLSSLHSHLTTQTSLIPALHAQLGLPETALREEISQLHAALVATVDQKIDERRREVEEWMDKCAALESECLKYNKALGAHAKGIAISVGELRRNQVLPKRFQDLIVYRDKISQLYQNKLQQCSTLLTKVNSLVRILGLGFYAPENTYMVPIAGTTEEDVTALKDVSPERFTKLEKELVRGKGEIYRRLTLLSQSFYAIGSLYVDLGIPMPLDDTDAPLLIPQRKVSSSSSSDPFLSSSVSSTTSNDKLEVEEAAKSYQAVFTRFIVRLEEAAEEGIDLEAPGNETFGVENVEPTLDLMAWSDDLKAELEGIKSRREARIQALYQELDILWHRLGVADAVIDEFIEKNRGSAEENVQAYEEEHERMLQLKRESMSTFIANARTEIERLWDDLHYGEEERGAFAPFVDDEYTEELFTLHEKEISRLKEERRVKAPILAAIKQYFTVCDEEKELKASATDQSRLLGRGARGDPGRLLREEKMRKRVAKEKPRLEKELMQSIPTWEQEYGQRFLVNGYSVFEMISETVHAAENEKENKKRPRPGSVPPRSTTPQPNVVRSSVLTTPGQYGENLGASKSVPAKKQRLGISNSMNSESFGYGGGHHPSSSPHKGDPSSKFGYGHGKTPSSLPRAVSNSRFGSGGHPQPHGYRIPSNGNAKPPSNASAGAAYTSIFSAIGGKRSGAKRESFKPRPSTDGYDAGYHGPGRQWSGVAGATVREEDEY